MSPILDDWLELGQQGIHPLQPDVMDINQVKAKYGHRVCLVGNIFMDHLVHKTPSDIEDEVRDRIEHIGKGGGYIISSSNSLQSSVNPKNYMAMVDEAKSYGRYPLQV